MRRGLCRLNSTVLSCRLNALNCISRRRSAGKLFHTRGPATEKLLSPKVLWVSGRKHVLSLAERRFGNHDWSVGCQQPDTTVSDQTTTDAQDRQSSTRSVVRPCSCHSTRMMWSRVVASFGTSDQSHCSVLHGLDPQKQYRYVGHAEQK